MKNMAEKMTWLREKMATLQAERCPHRSDNDDFDEVNEGQCRLVSLSKSMEAWMDSHFLSNMVNSDHKKRLERFKVPKPTRAFPGWCVVGPLVHM